MSGGIEIAQTMNFLTNDQSAVDVILKQGKKQTKLTILN